MLFERAAIVGVGLIGGSLALAARAAGLVGEVVGIGRSEANLDDGAARAASSTARCATWRRSPPVDLVVLAVPVRSTASVAAALLPHLRPGTLVTDVGSVKGEVVAACEAVLPADRPFVGGHPIAGSERAGRGGGRRRLFRGAPLHPHADRRGPTRPRWRGCRRSGRASGRACSA